MLLSNILTNEWAKKFAILCFNTFLWLKNYTELTKTINVN